MLCGCKHWPNFIVVGLFQRLMNPSQDGGNLSGKFSGIILGESRSVDILTLELHLTFNHLVLMVSMAFES